MGCGFSGGVRGALVLGCVAMFNCGGGDGDGGGDASPSGTGGASGSGGTAGTGGTQSVPVCREGAQCACENAVGVTHCDAAGNATCSCSGCSPLIARAEDPFNACGGSVFGFWRLKNVRYMGGCPFDVTIVSDAASIGYMLAFYEGGRAEATDYNIDAIFSFANGCGQLGSVLCGASRSVGVSGCTTDSCGLCTCKATDLVHSYEIVSWSTTGSQLTVSTEFFDPFVYDYCANGNQLLLRINSLELELERTVLGGAPQECASRTLANCTTGSGCHIGQCTGATQCAAYSTEADCRLYSACTWQPAGCAGTPPSSCALSDYGTVPGCDFLSPDTVCTGTAKPCSDYNVNTECANISGCSVVDACHGPTWDCSTLCTAAYGCPTTCTGTASCSNDVGGLCQSTFGCSYGPICTGPRPACSTYSATDCLNHAGCVLGAPP